MISLGFVKRSAMIAILAGEPRNTLLRRDPTRQAKVQVFATQYLYEGTTNVLCEVARHREKQMMEHAVPSEDDAYTAGELADAANAYVLLARGYPRRAATVWPWDEDYFKPSTTRKNLIKAITLLVAEVERIDRAEAKN